MDKARREKLKQLLKECTAHIVGRDGGSGAGFFIDEDLLLTCAHVAEGKVGDKVDVWPYQRKERTGEIIGIRDSKTDDMALVRVERLEHESPQPAVALSTEIRDGTEFIATGYPKGVFDNGAGLQEKPYKGNARLANDGTLVERLVFHAGGDRIVSGQSGGPVLSVETGAVVALMQYANEDEQGGGGVPIDRVQLEFDDVRRYLEEPPVAVRRWRDTLRREGWEKLGLKSRWDQTFDITVGGTPSAWEITLDTHSEPPCPNNGSALPDTISEALFAWAQSRRLHDQDDLKLLGSLLGAALFPAKVLSRLQSEAQCDHLLVRLKFDDESDLVDVPWEFAEADFAGKSYQIGTEASISFVRVAEHQSKVQVSTAPPSSPAQVLSIIVQPQNWMGSMPQKGGATKEKEWPGAGDLMRRLDTALKPCSRLYLTGDANPEPWHVRDVVDAKDPPPHIDIVHYMGFGNFDGECAEVAFSDGQGGVVMLPIEDLFEFAEKSGARLLVTQFFLPPIDLDFEPIPPRVYRQALRGSINAILYTRYHLHPRQTNAFNSSFYRNLGAGRRVEEAVQLARRDVQTNRPLKDIAGFGWFNLLTGPSSSMRFGRKNDATEFTATRRETSSRPTDDFRDTPGAPPAPQGHQDEFSFQDH